VETLNLKEGDRIDTGSGADMVVTSLTLTSRIEPTYNLTVADWHTFMVGEDQAVVHNACNPFKGQTAAQVDKMLRAKGFEPRGPDPLNGKGGYVNPRTGRSYHIDRANRFGEPPHVDVNRPRGYKALPKRKYGM
jgi:hypothetical protein